jgi:hypothetical protein
MSKHHKEPTLSTLLDEMNVLNGGRRRKFYDYLYGCGYLRDGYQDWYKEPSDKDIHGRCGSI